MPQLSTRTLIAFGALLFLGTAFLYGVYKTHYYQTLPKEIIVHAIVKDKLYSPEYRQEPATPFIFFTEDGVSHQISAPETVNAEQFKLLLLNLQSGKVGGLEVSAQIYAQTEKDSAVDIVFHPDYELQAMKVATIRKSK
jgi:hypothetical protein